MKIRPFPAGDRAPNIKVLLIPVILMVFGWLLVVLHPYLSTGFIGILIALTGALVMFPVGLLFADMFAATKVRRMKTTQNEDVLTGGYNIDPFEQTVDLFEDASESDSN